LITTTRSYDSPLRRARADATRKAILAAFAEQFGRPGTADVSVPEAAARGGVSVRTVYHHFPDREARLEALAAWADEAMGPVGSVLEVAEDIPGHIRLAYARAHRHESLTRAMIAAGFSEEVRRHRLRSRREQFTMLLEAIGAPAPATRRATAVVAMLATSEAGIPLVDVHGLTFSEAGEAAAEAAEVIIRRLREQAAT
jgi:AcrR family transcriptional regulator